MSNPTISGNNTAATCLPEIAKAIQATPTSNGAEVAATNKDQLLASDLLATLASDST